MPHIRPIVTAMLLAVTVFIYAIPARKGWHAAVLADGTHTELMLVGDEHGHWLQDRNGRAVAADATGTLRYITAEELARRKAIRSARMVASNDRRAARLARAKATATRATTSAYIGKKRGLVILVNFADRQMTATREDLDNAFNKVGYNADHHAGSVHDYFYDQSYGKFDLVFDVVGPYTVSQNMKHYGGNDSEGSDKYPAEMVIEAVKQADVDVNYKDYDWDNDGEVDQVFLIYAGYGENTYLPDAIWPHEWQLSYAKEYDDGSGAVTLDGVKIDTYAVSNELTGSSGFVLEGIGTACHEFSHCLGFPDFYDTNNDTDGTGVGMNRWDVLDYGSYNGYDMHGECPAEYTSYERWEAGWLTPTVLSSPCHVKDMAALADDANSAYIIYNDNNRKEYYLLENRQAGKWDVYSGTEAPGHGMLVLHVDYDSYAWKWNTVNNIASHQRMTIIPADNVLADTHLSHKGDPFPGTRGKTSLTDDTKPAAALFNDNTDGSKFLHKPITDIVETNGLISFTFMDSETNVPIVHEATEVSSSQFTVTWDAVKGAESYTLEAAPSGQETPEPTTGKTLLSESFSGCISPKETTTNIATRLDSYTDVKGWQGHNVYQGGPGCLKVGKTEGGYVITPAVLASSGKLTVCVEAKAYNKDKNHAGIYLCDSDGSQLGIQDGITFGTDDYTKSIVTFSYSNSCTVMFWPDKRAFLTAMYIYDGEYTLDDITNGGVAAKQKRIKATVDSRGVFTFEGITETSLTLSGLTASSYDYRVRAIKGGVAQPWSEKRTIDLSTAAIHDVTPTLSRRADNRIYNLNGQYVGTDTTMLPCGTYIVGGKKKVVRNSCRNK